jgi:hypothetical protein
MLLDILVGITGSDVHAMKVLVSVGIGEDMGVIPLIIVSVGKIVVV